MSVSDVHVWTFRTDGPARFEEDLALLPPDERDRAERFHFDIHRHRYAAAHAITRRVLGGYLGGGPVGDPFVAGPHGKPGLEGEPLRFNLSHSENVAMLAITLGTEVGVDVEAIKPDVEVEALATQFFSPAERQALLALPADRIREGFFHLWTQKEAYLKGRGDGVVLGLDHFDTEADPRRPAALLEDRRDREATQVWRLISVASPPGFRGALATRGGPLTLLEFAPSEPIKSS